MKKFLSIIFFLSFLLSLAIAEAFPIPKDNKAIFDIIRKNKVIGTYEINFSEKDDFLIVETNIDIEVKIVFVVAYKFFHQSKEIWKDGKFLKVEAYTDFEDEREYFIDGEIKEDFFMASGMDGDLKLDKNLLPSNYWNIDVMQQTKIFDTQKGIQRELKVKKLGIEKIEINNKKINCKKFTLNASSNTKDLGPFPEYTLWYSDNNELMKFKFINWKDKKLVEIVRKN
tara:strand:- start:63 stop:743 length:681 start_codon:yes stop_codon:yes gene_type:complete